MEDFDRVSARVTVAGALGALGGVGTAMHKGYRIPRTMGLTAFSCAMVASACLTGERLVANLLRGGPLEKELGRGPFLIMTHACGGFLGGGVLGYLYIRKPIHGVIFFVPVMSAIGYAESLFQDLADEQRQFRNKTEQQ